MSLLLFTVLMIAAMVWAALDGSRRPADAPVSSATRAAQLHAAHRHSAY